MSGRDVVTVDFSKQDLWDFGDDVTAAALKAFLFELDDLGREVVEKLQGRKVVKWTKKGGGSTRVYKAGYSYRHHQSGNLVTVAPHWGQAWTPATWTSDRVFTEWPIGIGVKEGDPTAKVGTKRIRPHSRDLWEWRVDIVDGEHVALHVTNPAPYVKYIKAKNLNGKSPLSVLVRSPLKKGARKTGKRAKSILEG